MRILKSPVRTLTQISLSDLSPNPAQPRRTFPEAAIDALAESIREHGLLSPLLVRRVGPGKYELIAGERRLRALKKLGRTRAEAIIVAAYDMQSAILALIENIQREQLHFLEEARACRAILDSEGMPQEELARQLGRSPSALANRLRLLHLTAETQQAVVETGLTERHARALLAVTDPQKQLALALRAGEGRLTVRQLEAAVAKAALPRRKTRGFPRDPRLFVNAVMDTVKRINALGCPAETSVSETASGTEIHILLRHGPAQPSAKQARNSQIR